MKKHLSYILSFLMISSMVGLSMLLNEKEIIFPEIFALVIGAWVCPQLPWKTNKFEMITLLSLLSVIGVLIVRYVELDYMYRIMIAFFCAAVVLLAAKCSFLPIVSACVLPVIMNTRSFIYPLSVFVMVLIIVGVRLILEKKGFVTTADKNFRSQFSFKTETVRWLLIFVAFGAMCAAAVGLNLIFLVAPPVLVAFAEMTYSESPAKKSPFSIWLVTSLCAVTGAYARLFLTVRLGAPLIITSLIITASVLAIISLSKKLFPPAGALALLPLIIPENRLADYPAQVMAGLAVFTATAILIGKVTEKIASKQECGSEKSSAASQSQEI